MRLELWVTTGPACRFTEFSFRPTRFKLRQVMTNLGFQINFSGCFMEEKKKKLLRNKASCWKPMMSTFTLR